MPLPMYKEPENSTSAPFVLAVAAGKGGVGKSSISVNLALALKEQGLSVGLMDTDVYGPSVRKMLPEDQMPSQKGERIFPALSRGIKVISMAYFRGDDQAAAVRAPVANGIISQFLKQVDWGDVDVLVIDFPPGTGDIQLTLSQQARVSAALVVTTPQEVALLDVRKAMNLFSQVKVPLLGVVENMSYYVEKSGEKVALFGRGGGEKLARDAGVPFFGQIPLDPGFSKGCDQGDPLFLKEPEAPVSVAIREVSHGVYSHLCALREREKGALERFELVWREMD